MRQSAVLHNPAQAHATFNALWAAIKPSLMDGKRLIVEVKPETRSTEQNRRLWAMLTDISRQVEWYGKRLTAEDWKHVFSSGLRKLEVVPNLDGSGFVALGLSTSSMTKGEMGDLMTLMEAFGAERGVEWSEPESAAVPQ
jgi:hypothetical protein